jgi:transposase
MDLHSNNVVIGLMEKDGKRLGSRKIACDIDDVVAYLAPHKDRLKMAAVESTYNWYWLVDGLAERGYPVVLANPAGMAQYDGLKHGDDHSDAFFIADLLRLDILPQGHIYDRDLRPVRDMLRRRMSLVRQRTALMISFKSLYSRTTGAEMPLKKLKDLDVETAQKLYEHPANNLIAGLQLEQIEHLDAAIKRVEKVVLESARELPYYANLSTLPGIGRILGMTITMEVGDIKRFAGPGEFASYCRTVDAGRTSNGKKKGDNNSKCGNKYLSWAFVEAANFARRYDEQCRQWYDRKAAKKGKVLATKALACKMAKAAWYVMARNTSYDATRMFGATVEEKKTMKP